MSKYISQYTEQTATQSTDKYLFQRGLTYYHITNANLVTSLTSSLNLAQYLTTATAASTYVPLTRTLTINGSAQDLSSDRSWTIATDITIGTTAIVSGTPGRILFESATNKVSQSANLFWDNSNVRLGIGVTPSYTIHAQVNTNDMVTLMYGYNNNGGTSTATRIVAGNAAGEIQFGKLYSGSTWSLYGSNVADAFIRSTEKSMNFQTGIIGGSSTDAFVFNIGTYNKSAAEFVVGKTDSYFNTNLAIGATSTSSTRLYSKGSTSDSTSYVAKFDNSSSSALHWLRNDGYQTFNSSTFTNGNFFFNAVDNSVNTLTVQRSQASATVGTYAVIGVVNTNSSANNYTRAYAFSDNYSYDLCTIHGERIDANRGAWHLYTRSGAGTLVNHLSTYVDGSGNSIVRLANIPTSSAGLPSGALWNDSGTIKIV